MEEESVVREGVSPVPSSLPASAVGDAETSLKAIATAVLDDVVGVVVLDAGMAELLEIALAVPRIAADVLVTNEVTGVSNCDVVATCAAVVEDAPAATICDVDAIEVVEVVLGVAAGSVARLAGKVVAVRGTAVHCSPSIRVVENPAGRDMVK